MNVSFYGPTQSAAAAITRLLALPATGREQDWEIEMVDPCKFDDMLQLLSEGALGLEERSALALLLCHTLDELDGNGQDTSSTVPRVHSLLARDGEVLQRIRFYWSHLQAGKAVQDALA